MGTIYYSYTYLEGEGIRCDVYTDADREDCVATVEVSFEELLGELMSRVANADGVITAEDDREYAEDIADSLLDARNRIVIALNRGRQ